MEKRYKRHEVDPGPNPGDEGDGEGLGETRARADELLRAGHDAINRALSSGRSEQFLKASRQTGGQ